MSDSKPKIERIGFSTGALEKGNFRGALEWLEKKQVQSVELSALRLEELEPLVRALDSLPIRRFHYISFHAPSSFPKEAEKNVVKLLENVAQRGMNIVIHPDVIKRFSLWKKFGSQLLIENMDRRKNVGRTAEELGRIFQFLPAARLCLDVAHARQMDTTLTLLSQIVSKFSSRIAEIHISELDSLCQHQPMSAGAVTDYRIFARSFNTRLPVIIESMLDGNRVGIRMDEFNLALKAMHPMADKNKEKTHAKSLKKGSSRFHFGFSFRKPAAKKKVESIGKNRVHLKRHKFSNGVKADR